jgi:hypothetical protein
MAALLPFAAGTIPKVLVAYAGTAVTGHAATYFYEFGARPTGEQIRRFYERAADIANTLRPGGRDERDAIEGEFSEAQTPATPESAPVLPDQIPVSVDEPKRDDVAAR